jgi:hypothetical protein
MKILAAILLMSCLYDIGVSLRLLYQERKLLIDWFYYVGPAELILSVKRAGLSLILNFLAAVFFIRYILLN